MTKSIMPSETSVGSNEEIECTHKKLPNQFPNSLVEKKRDSLFPLGLSIANTTLPSALRDIDADFRVCVGGLLKLSANRCSEELSVERATYWCKRGGVFGQASLHVFVRRIHDQISSVRQAYLAKPS